MLTKKTHPTFKHRRIRVPAKNSNKFWTIDDLNELKARYEKGASHKELAVHFGRSVSAISHQVNRVCDADNTSNNSYKISHIKGFSKSKQQDCNSDIAKIASLEARVAELEDIVLEIYEFIENS